MHTNLRRLTSSDDQLVAQYANAHATYHQLVRNQFGFGDNQYVLGYQHHNWLFDQRVSAIYDMPFERQCAWYSQPNTSAVVCASAGIDPWQVDRYIQRTGICLIETAELSRFSQRSARRNYLSEEDALTIMHRYPSESQLLGVKPLLASEVVVFLEDTLFEEKWDEVTGGLYHQSPRLQRAFQEQIERTMRLVQAYVAMLHPQHTPNIRFVRFSDLCTEFNEAVQDWVNELLNIQPYTGSEPFTAPTAARVLYTYGGDHLARVAGFPAEKQIILTRQLTHCVLEHSWTHCRSQIMDWFAGAVQAYFAQYPRLMLGYFDLFSGQSRISFADRELAEKIHHGCVTPLCDPKAIASPFPLCDNAIFQRALPFDFLPGVLGAVYEIGLNAARFAFPAIPAMTKSEIRELLRNTLEQLQPMLFERYAQLFDQQEDTSDVRAASPSGRSTVSAHDCQAAAA